MVRSVSGMQGRALAWRRAGRKIGFVPTMGYLHDGHLSLIRAARRRVGADGILVVSLFVNPTQFGAGEDLGRYPRDPERDRRLCAAAGVDVLFAPADAAMYPGRAEGGYSTYVVEERLSRGMEGASRPTHFRGVTTVVAKLLNLVLPTVVVFGAKDYQQAAVVRRMVSDLNFPVRVLVAPTVRERDGLALSSRNTYLNSAERAQAAALWEALETARREARHSDRGVPVSRLRRRLTRQIERHPGARVDYVEFFEPTTLERVVRVGRGTQVALAVHVGRTRLIDNARL